MSVISNTTVLSNFAVVEQLDLLQPIYGRVYLAGAVYTELEEGVLAGYSYLVDVLEQVSPFVPDGWLILTNPATLDEVTMVATFPTWLHRGEAASLAIAAQRQWLFLTDDWSARNVAHTQGIAISGTLGCLLRGVRQQYLTLDHANVQLSRMIAAGYRAPVDDLRLLISI
jgi:predicted nucleic acid-binding protein